MQRKIQAVAILYVLHEWGINNKVKTLCCDTTAFNTYCFKGTYILLEDLLEKRLNVFTLYLQIGACTESLVWGKAWITYDWSGCAIY